MRVAADGRRRRQQNAAPNGLLQRLINDADRDPAFAGRLFRTDLLHDDLYGQQITFPGRLHHECPAGRRVINEDKLFALLRQRLPLASAGIQQGRQLLPAKLQQLQGRVDLDLLHPGRDERRAFFPHLVTGIFQPGQLGQIGRQLPFLLPVGNGSNEMGRQKRFALLPGRQLPALDLG